MKRSLSKRMATAVAILGMAAVLASCGSAEPVPPIQPGLPGPGGIPGIPGGGGCIPLAGSWGMPQQGVIGFTGQNVYWDGRQIRAGFIPGHAQAFGQVYTGGGGVGGPYQRSTGEGSISMSIQQNPLMGGMPGWPVQPGFGGSATTAQIQGMVQLSQMTLQQILTIFGGGGGWNGGWNGWQQPGIVQPGFPQPGMMPQTCVSGIAVDLQWSPQGNVLYDGWVYLYLNNSQNGYKMYF